MKQRFYYSVQNGGDGSAYPIFVESEELAKWDQDNLSEGWGEDCSGYIEVESDSPMTADVTTKEKYLFRYFGDGTADHVIEFVKKFFPEDLPDFEVQKNEANKRYYVYVDGKRVHVGYDWDGSDFVVSESGRKKYEYSIKDWFEEIKDASV